MDSRSGQRIRESAQFADKHDHANQTQAPHRAFPFRRLLLKFVLFLLFVSPYFAFPWWIERQREQIGEMDLRIVEQTGDSMFKFYPNADLTKDIEHGLVEITNFLAIRALYPGILEHGLVEITNFLAIRALYPGILEHGLVEITNFLAIRALYPGILEHGLKT